MRRPTNRCFMKSHGKKIIAPIIVVAALILVNIRIVTILLRIPLPTTVVVMGLVLPLFITVILIIVLAERIREIKKGEEDDLSDY